MTDSQHEYVQFRMAKARESIQESKILLEAGHLNSSVSRLYYACFYSASALLYLNDLHSRRHSGVRSMFGHHFVRSGRIPRNIASVYTTLFDARTQADYQDLYVATKENIDAWTPLVIEFVDRIQLLLDEG